jgi:hypothetical protein
MSKTKDLNRLRKIYPLLRQKPVYGKFLSLEEIQEQSGIDVEVNIINFNNEFQKTYEFQGTYSEIPIIALTPEEENVNVFITSLTNSSVVIESSSDFTGKVHIQVFDAS